MRHDIDPDLTIMVQLRSIGIPERLPHPICMVYRFFDEVGDLLYVGVTVRPGGRWGTHRRDAAWWPIVRHVSVEWHPYVRAALSAEDAAIKAERPGFNLRSVPSKLRRDSGASPTLLTRYSGVVPPRVGGGVGGRGGGGFGTLQDQSFNLTVGRADDSNFGLGAAR